MNKNRGLHIGIGRTSPIQQTKVSLGNKLRVNQSAHTGGSYRKRKFGDGGCGCGSNHNPKQVRNTMK